MTLCSPDRTEQQQIMSVPMHRPSFPLFLFASSPVRSAERVFARPSCQQQSAELKVQTAGGTLGANSVVPAYRVICMRNNLRCWITATAAHDREIRPVGALW